MTRTRLVICPYCGVTQPAGERCRACSGLFEPLSRQATHNTMGPWFVRNPQRPFQPGCSYETLVRLIDRGLVTKYSIIRGPTTRQFWTVARHVPGVAHLLGYCHACDADVDPDDHGCPNCGVPFGAYLDRNYLGLPEVRPLPWEAPDSGERDHSPTPGLTWSSSGGREQRLSSFAPDEELFGTAGAPAHHPHGAPEPGQAGAPQHLPETAAETSAATIAASRAGESRRAESDDDLLSPAMRSMQRRLARQARTIRVLIALVVVLAIAGAIFNLVTVLAAGSGDGEPPQTQGQKAPVVGSDQDRPSESSGVEQREKAASSGSVIESEVDGSSDGSLMAADLEEPAVEEQTLQDERSERAMALKEAAEDESRSLDDRIADLEAALELLQEIEADAEGQAAAELAEEIQRISDELEYLKLKKFYG